MNKVVVFTSNNARILYVDDVTQYSTPNCIINPDLTQVRGLPPHCWKIKDGVIIPKTVSEIQKTESLHTSQGVDNNVTSAVLEHKTSIPWGTIALVMIAIAAIVEAIHIIWKI